MGFIELAGESIFTFTHSPWSFFQTTSWTSAVAIDTGNLVFFFAIFPLEIPCQMTLWGYGYHNGCGSFRGVGDLIVNESIWGVGYLISLVSIKLTGDLLKNVSIGFYGNLSAYVSFFDHVYIRHDDSFQLSGDLLFIDSFFWVGDLAILDSFGSYGYLCRLGSFEPSGNLG